MRVWAAVAIALVMSACASVPRPAVVAPIAPIPELTLPVRGGALHLAVVGDAGDGSEKVARGIAALHLQHPLDGIILTGDNVYPCGIRSIDDPAWHVLDPLLALNLPIYAVLGNHDRCGNAAAQVEWSRRDPRWRLVAEQYAVRSEVADFAMIDTTPYARGKSTDTASAIPAVFAESRAPWRVVVGHHTIESSGWHGWFPRAEARRMKTLLPSLREAHVALYVCGHDHHLELIAGAPSFLISGAGSDPIPMVLQRPQSVYPKHPAFREPLGFAELEISAPTLRVRFHDDEGRPLSDWFDIGGRNLETPGQTR